MDNIMSIAATGTSMSASKLQQNVSISVLKKAMNTQESQAAELIQSIAQAAPQPAAAAAAPSQLLNILV